MLYGPAYQSLKFLGQFTGKLTVQNKSHQETIFVVRGLKNDLLGLPALTSLQLVQRVGSTYTALADVKKDFPKLFTGLGDFGKPYAIKLKEDAKPHALYTPRNVPIPLQGKVLEELNRMESLGVISKVSEPTSWCAGMVVVPKQSGDVRICLMDDILVFGKTQLEHVQRLADVLKRLESANVTLNPNKCVFNKTSVKFLGHMIDRTAVKADPAKTEAICRMSAPSSVSDLRRFLGLVNQLGKFSPNISELTQLLRELMSSKRAWLWGQEQENAFTRIKEELVKPTTLTLYDPNAEAKISADASSFGLGAVLLQRAGEDWKPVAYASRSMTPTERRYAQIEKRRWSSHGLVASSRIMCWGEGSQ